MIELEIQVLSERRQGLLVEIGHFVIANGFILQRQRLIQDPHGILLTMVVSGPARKKRALQAALDADERIISFQLAPFVEGEQKPHFAASRALSNYVPAPMPEPEPAAEVAVAASPGVPTTPAIPTAAFDEIAPTRLVAVPEPSPNGAAALPLERVARSQPESTPDFEFILPEPQRAPLASPSVVEEPFVELVPLEADEDAIASALSKLDTDYPQIMPRLLALAQSVPEAARESSLRLAGQRIGRWVSARDHAQAGEFDLIDSIAQVGMPALQALVDVEQEGGQLRICHSPLCAETGHSGCTFFSGFLEGVLAPVLASSEVTIFQVCCHSYGADACVLALSD
jgi:predicted hydrocarbon binding protein